MSAPAAAALHGAMRRSTAARDMSVTGPAAPVDDARRIRDLDVIRGAALFGVVWMNLHESTRWFVPHARLDALPSAPVDRVVDALAAWLVLGKAQCLFGILFGFGFAVFTERAMRRRSDAATLYARRLTALLVLGVAQYVFLWWGDILHDYALVGFALLLSRRAPDRVLLVAGATLMLFADPLGALVARAAGHVDLHAIQGAERGRFHVVMWRALSAGDYAGLLHGVVLRTRLMYGNATIVQLWGSLLGQFLFGAWLFRKGWLHDVAAHRRLFRRAALVAVPVGLALSGWDLFADASLAGDVAVPLLAIGYGATLVTLGGHASVHRRLGGLAALGRMALTNYVGQSFVYFFVAYGFGLDLFARVGTTADLALAIVVTTLQIAASRWWLRRYRFGPLEWVWRSITYDRAQSMRLEGTPVARR